jgi:hypothetical protein
MSTGDATTVQCNHQFTERRTIRQHDDRYLVDVCLACGAWSSNLMPDYGRDPQASPAAMLQAREARRASKHDRRAA